MLLSRQAGRAGAERSGISQRVSRGEGDGADEDGALVVQQGVRRQSAVMTLYPAQGGQVGVCARRGKCGAVGVPRCKGVWVGFAMRRAFISERRRGGTRGFGSAQSGTVSRPAVNYVFKKKSQGMRSETWV